MSGEMDRQKLNPPSNLLIREALRIQDQSDHEGGVAVPIRKVEGNLFRFRLAEFRFQHAYDSFASGKGHAAQVFGSLRREREDLINSRLKCFALLEETHPTSSMCSRTFGATETRGPPGEKELQ